MIGGTKFVGFSNYIRLFHDPPVLGFGWRVALFTMVQVPIMLFLSAAMALGLGFHEAARCEVLPHHHVPAVRGAGRGVDVDVGFRVWREIRSGRFVERLAGTDIDVLAPSVLLASIGNIVTWEFTGYNMLIFYSSLSTIPHSLYEAASIDGASEWQIVKSIKLPELRGSLAITVIFSIIGSFQLFNEPSILQNMVPGNAITTYYTPNMYAYNLSFSGNQSNYAAALAIVMAVITMAIAYSGPAQQPEGADEVTTTYCCSC